MKQFNIYPLLLISLFTFAIMQSCTDETPEPMEEKEDPKDTTTTPTTYTNTTKAIFDGNCTFIGCHNTGSIIGSLATYSAAKAFASNGRISGALRRQAGFPAMPKNRAKLPDTTIVKVEKWIDGGFLE